MGFCGGRGLLLGGGEFGGQLAFAVVCAGLDFGGFIDSCGFI